MTASRQARGRFGEDAAARWYTERGYSVLARNWRTPGGELDLVVGRGRLVVFCEVKARSSTAYGSPAEAVTPAKQLRLRRLAAAWLATTVGPPVEVRFDVASVLGTRIEVIEGAF